MTDVSQLFYDMMRFGAVVDEVCADLKRLTADSFTPLLLVILLSTNHWSR